MTNSTWESDAVYYGKSFGNVTYSFHSNFFSYIEKSNKILQDRELMLVCKKIFTHIWEIYKYQISGVDDLNNQENVHSYSAEEMAEIFLNLDNKEKVKFLMRLCIVIKNEAERYKIRKHHTLFIALKLAEDQLFETAEFYLKS